MTRRWLAVREYAGGGPVVVGAAWTAWGARRVLTRDRRCGQYAPDYLYGWRVVRRRAATWLDWDAWLSRNMKESRG